MNNIAVVKQGLYVKPQEDIKWYDALEVEMYREYYRSLEHNLWYGRTNDSARGRSFTMFTGTAGVQAFNDAMVSFIGSTPIQTQYRGITIENDI